MSTKVGLDDEFPSASAKSREDLKHFVGTGKSSNGLKRSILRTDEESVAGKVCFGALPKDFFRWGAMVDHETVGNGSKA